MDLDWLRGVRSALESLWTERRSAGQCIRTAALLHDQLGGTIRGGWPHENGVILNSGFRAPGGAWHFHYWLERGGLIIDLTADQFGGLPVTVTPVSDPRYRACSHDHHVTADVEHVRRVSLPLYRDALGPLRFPGGHP